MTTCGYAHEVLSGFLSSNRVTALILLKFELFNNVYLCYIKTASRPTRFFFMLIGRKMRISSACSSSYNENKPRLIDFIKHKVFFNPPTNTRLSTDRRPTVRRLIKLLYGFGFSIHACIAYSSKIDSLY